MHLPKYLSIANFESDYQKDFEVWKKQYPNGSELDYLNELRGEYSQFDTDDDVFLGIRVKRKPYKEELEGIGIAFSDLDKGGYIDVKIDMEALCVLLSQRFEWQFEEIEYNQKDFEELSLRELCRKYKVLDAPSRAPIYDYREKPKFEGKDICFSNCKGVRSIIGGTFLLHRWIISDLVEYFFTLWIKEQDKNGIRYGIGFDERKYKDFQLLVKNMLILIDEKIENVKGNKPHQVILQKMERSPKVEASSKENPVPQQITPIKLELNQTQIVYLFQQLVEKRYLRLNKNPALWNLISQYFVDVNDKPLKNIHQVKDRLINNSKGKPKREADTIDEIVSFLDTFKD